MKDGFTNVTTDYSYDLTGRLVQSAQSGSRSGRSSYTYDNMDRVTMQHNFVNDYTQWMTYTYGDDGLLSHSSQHNMGTDFSYTYLNCVESETVKWNNQAVLTNHYGYVMDTQMVQSIQPVVGGVNQGYYSYSYDKAGNIRSVSKNGELLLQYWYDGLGQLTRVDDARQQKTFIYSYSDVGNLEYKAQASYTTTANLLGPPSNYVYYGYSDSEWPDLLTMYNGQSISYDLIGNPLSYRDGMTMSWENGRQLASLQKGTGVVNYSYDVNGQRVKKTAGTDTVDFYYDDNGRLIKQEDDGGNIWFYYNPTGAAASMSYHGTHYYFLKNLQGDVVALVNMQGDIAARYVYDAWGDIVSVTDANGNAITDQNHVANQNPIRYRGYYYDTESGLYYLNSRYYDPVTGRFVNADSVDLLNYSLCGLLQYNMYTYCFNNSVNYYDPNGNFIAQLAGLGALLYALAAEQTKNYNYINNIIAQWRFSGGYIYDQDLYDQFRLGLYGASWNGCGWIAAYNAMKILGNPRPPAEIIQHFDGAWGNIALGTFGVNPFVMIDFFQSYGYGGKYAVLEARYNILEPEARKASACILLYAHSQGAHYIAFKWNGKQYDAYNATKKNFISIESYLKDVGGTFLALWAVN